jgi:hypothetical protein
MTPAPQRANAKLRQLLSLGNVFALQGGTGLGRTTVPLALHGETGGAFLTMLELRRTALAPDPWRPRRAGGPRPAARREP